MQSSYLAILGVGLLLGISHAQTSQFLRRERALEQFLESRSLKASRPYPSPPVTKQSARQFIQQQSDLGWDAPFFAQGPSGPVYGIDSRGDSLYVAGAFAGADDLATPGIALWDGSAWRALAKGLRDDRKVVAVGVLLDGNRVYVGGQFDSAGNVAANGIAVWEGNEWKAMDSGRGSYFRSFGFWRGKLFASMDSAIFSWNGTRWQKALPGLSGYVSRLKTYGDQLWAIGKFISSTDASVRDLAYWDGVQWTNPWKSSLGIIRSFAVLNSVPFVLEYIADSPQISGTDRLSKWDGSKWLTLESQVPDVSYPSRMVEMETDGKELFLIRKSDNEFKVLVEKWDQSKFQPFQSCLGYGSIDIVHARNGKVFLGGAYLTAGESARADNLLAWDGLGWKGLSAKKGLGPASRPIVMASDGKGLFFGGRNLALSRPYPSIHIARWDGSSWDLLPGGVQDFGVSSKLGPIGYASVVSVAFGNGNLYAGGYFESIADGMALGIARRDASGWHAMGDGYPGLVFSIAVKDKDVFVGGSPDTETVSFATPALRGQGVGKWNGQSWERVGQGLRGTINKLAVFQNRLYANGFFHIGEDTASCYSAVWDGQSWTLPWDLKVTSMDIREDMCEYHGSLYIAGNSLRADRSDPEILAKWDGKALALFDTLATVRQLATDGKYLYVLGRLKGYEDLLTRWDGTDWLPIGTRGISEIRSMAVHQGYLYVGGQISDPGGKPAYHVARWNTGTGTWTRFRTGSISDLALERDRIGFLPSGGQWISEVAGRPIFDVRGRRQFVVSKGLNASRGGSKKSRISAGMLVIRSREASAEK